MVARVRKGMIVVNPTMPRMDERTFLATAVTFLDVLSKTTITEKPEGEAWRPPPYANVMLLTVQLGEMQKEFFTQSEAAKRLGISTSTGQRASDFLKENGLVAYEPHPTDGRKVILHATAKGWVWMRRVYEACLPVVAENWDRQLVHLTSAVPVKRARRKAYPK